MTTLSDFRRQYPQYDDMDDSALADALHSKFYSDMPRVDFDTKLGLSATLADSGQRFDESGVPVGGNANVVPTGEMLPGTVPAGSGFGGPAMNLTAGLNDAIYGVAGAPVDITRGAMNLAGAGISDNSFGGSRWIGETLGAIRPELDPANTKASTGADRIARGAGHGIAGTVLPATIVGGLGRAGVLGAQGAEMGAKIAGRSSSVPAAAADAFAGATAGAGATAAMEMSPEGYSPLAGLIGGLGGGFAGAGMMALPGIGMATARAGRELAAPLTAAGRERMAGQQLHAAASNPGAVREALDAPSEPLIPGSEPTTGQLTGDMGLLAAERAAQSRNPADFQTRRAEQNTARRQAMDEIQPTGSAETVTHALRQRLTEIDRDTLNDFEMTRSTAQHQNRAIGQGASPDEAGDTIRQTLQRRRDLAVERERRLWAAVDPDGTFALPPQDARRTVQEILSDLPASSRPPSAEESAIYDVVRQYGDVMPFREISALRSRVSEALADERSRHGKTQAWSRLVQLRGAIESDLENAVSRRVLVEEHAVAAGQMQRENTLEANFARQADEWKAERLERASQASGQSFGTGGPASGAVRTTSVRAASGGKGAAGSGLRNAPRDPGLPQDAGRAGGRYDDLTAADIRSLKPNDPFFVRSGDNQSFVPVAPGRPDLGTAPRIEGTGDIPIRVRRGDFTRHVATPVHYADAEILGYSDPWVMMKDIAGSWTQMHRGEGGRILLVKPSPDQNGVAVVELAKVDGADYWRAVTAGRRRESQLGQQLAVRERTPDARSGTELPLVDGPTEAGRNASFARAASDTEYSPFDPAAKGRLDRATEATRRRAGTFDNRQLGPILQRPADHAPYNMESARVAARAFVPGGSGFERMQAVRQAMGPNSTRGLAAIEGYAIDTLRRQAMREDGTLDPAKVDAWRRSYSEALRAFPELDVKIGNAARASETVADVAAARKVALDDAQKGALGRLIGTDDPQDVTRIIGGLFSRQDSVAQLGRIRTAIGNDKEALQGFRKATADFLSSRLMTNTEAATSGRTLISADQFQTFVRQNRKALSTVFSADEVKTFDDIAADLQRANRSLSAVKIPGQSNTVQDALAVTSGDTATSILGKLVMTGMAPAGGALAGFGLGGGGSGAALGAGAAAFVAALRQNGIQKVDDLVRDALLHPERARMLMARAKPNDPDGSERLMHALARRYAKAAVAASAISTGSDDRRRPPAPAMPQIDVTPLPPDQRTGRLGDLMPAP